MVTKNHGHENFYKYTDELKKQGMGRDFGSEAEMLSCLDISFYNLKNSFGEKMMTAFLMQLSVSAIKSVVHMRKKLNPEKRRHSIFLNILSDMRKIHSDKNHDYAASDDPLSNFKICEDYFDIPAWQGALVRMTDKKSRVDQLLKNKKDNYVKNESVEDTLIDMANYAILTRILFEEK